MIESIKDKTTLRVWNSESTKKFPGELCTSAQEKMLLLAAMKRCPEDLWAYPSLKIEKLSSERAGQWSIRINKQYRICFNWNEETQNVYNLEITDYH
jgi:proteic killer suppression protein